LPNLSTIEGKLFFGCTAWGDDLRGVLFEESSCQFLKGTTITSKKILERFNITQIRQSLALGSVLTQTCLSVRNIAYIKTQSAQVAVQSGVCRLRPVRTKNMTFSLHRQHFAATINEFPLQKYAAVFFVSCIKHAYICG
jgi:hypothetical protein